MAGDAGVQTYKLFSNASQEPPKAPSLLGRLVLHSTQVTQGQEEGRGQALHLHLGQDLSGFIPKAENSKHL